MIHNKNNKIPSLEEIKKWVKHHAIEDIECVVPDISGIARGKLMPAYKFIDQMRVSIPMSIFFQTISGTYPNQDDIYVNNDNDGDVKLVPDYSTLSIVPWSEDPTASIIYDPYINDDQPLMISPRNILKKILLLYKKHNLKPLIAPEIEFYLVAKNTDPDFPLEPPIGRSGRAETARQSYSISAVNEYEKVVDDIYEYSEAQGLEIDTLIHEEGAAQLEINLKHGDALELADEVFLFKRTIREAAMKNGMYATFMAKPIQNEPGSAMHIHQSIINCTTGKNIFSLENGQPSEAFYHFLGGQQKYLENVTSIFCPYVNSYRRLIPDSAAPTNCEWGYDHRRTALRIPASKPDARRIEIRVPSSDCNPYLAIAASLAIGLLGLEKKIKPKKAWKRPSQNLPISLPRDLLNSLKLLNKYEELNDILGKDFIKTYKAIKAEEFETFMQVISPWEREFLLLNV